MISEYPYHQTYQTLHIFGELGSISVNKFWHADSATLKVNEKEPVVFTEMEGNGYNYEAVATMEAIRAGDKENSLMPLEDTLAIIELSDTIRAQWGLKYPSDDK